MNMNANANANECECECECGDDCRWLRGFTTWLYYYVAGVSAFQSVQSHSAEAGIYSGLVSVSVKPFV